MQELDDNALLREYVKNDSEAAFAELVARHVGKVYSTAMRHTRNAHQAEEITQAVFVILAQKARKLRSSVILSGWLYQAARLTAVTLLRGEIRRARREREALMQTLQTENEPDHWRHIAPLLDDALARLGEKDRHAVVLRFFDGKNFGEVGAALGGSEDAAKMRVSRALEKLRKCFAKRGVTLTVAAIAGAVSANSVHAAPVGLAKTISTVALAKGAAVSTSTLTLVKGALKLMAWTKAKMMIAACTVVLFAAGTTMIIVKEVRSPAKSWKPTNPYPGDWIWEFNSQTLAQVPPILILRPTQMPASWIPSEMFGKNRYLARGKTLKELIAAIYSQKDSEAKVNFITSLPDDKFDCIVVVPSQTNWPDALESEINKKFNLVEQWSSQAGKTVVMVNKTN
jgi:RNA polymerase sigma factor (sigma-70 family)